MKNKVYCLATIGMILSSSLFAQSNVGLFPNSFSNESNIVKPTSYEFPKQDYSELTNKTDGAYMVAKFVFTDISFPESGTLTKLESGDYVWQVKVNVDGAKGLGFYFDKFTLPQGVNMFTYNNNKRHVFGPFTSENNDERNVFATDAVFGGEAYLELNIASFVNFEDIDLRVNRLASYFRGIEELEYFDTDYPGYGTFDSYDNAAYGSSSKCMINANCSDADGYQTAKEATVKEIIPMGTEGIGYCSGTMVNNTGNSGPANCTKYLLTATHCESGNYTGTHASFGEWIVKFNYQTPGCEQTTTAPVANNINGVKFVARDPYNASASASELDADFMLLEITGLIPGGWNVKMAGWNRNPDHQTAYVGNKNFVFFHHPNGDVKKFSSSKLIYNLDVATWGVEFAKGFGAPGSSGSAMFNDNQQVIGIASTANYGGGLPDTCAYSANNIREAFNSSKQVFYAKVDYSWENPSISSPSNAQKLSPWLNPTGSEAMSIEPVTTRCEPLSIQKLETSFNGDFNIYPNPSADGMFQMNIKMNEPAAANIQVVDVMGRQVFTTNVAKLQSQIVNLNLTNLANGTYLVKIANEYGQITKKVVINK